MTIEQIIIIITFIITLIIFIKAEKENRLVNEKLICEHKEPIHKKNGLISLTITSIIFTGLVGSFLVGIYYLIELIFF